MEGVEVCGERKWMRTEGRIRDDTEKQRMKGTTGNQERKENLMLQVVMNDPSPKFTYCISYNIQSRGRRYLDIDVAEMM